MTSEEKEGWIEKLLAEADAAAVEAHPQPLDIPVFLQEILESPEEDFMSHSG